MSRSKHFVTGLLSSYAAIGINVLYTIASVPLAFHYLDKAQFGLWALVTQLSGYLMLLELGMTGSIARSLSDHKDDVASGIYGSILRTGSRVFMVQGVAVALLGLIVAGCAPPLLGLPPRLHHPFTLLMAAQGVLSGMRLSIGALASPMWCHQRLDLSNLIGSISLVANFGFLWLGFHFGWHIYSLTVASFIGFCISIALTYYICRSHGFYPPPEHKGRFDLAIFRSLFRFGSGLFMMNLGSQLASASQVIVASRLLGVEAATTWSVATKIFSMSQQFVARVLDSSAGGLAEMVVRGELSRLLIRYRDLVVLSAIMAVAASAAIILANGPFVEIWTAGKVTWASWNNLLLGCVLFSTAVTRCHTSLVGINKQVRGMKYVYLFEGVAFVILSLVLVPKLGLTGLLTAALACNFAITGVYAVGRTAEYFGISRKAVLGWAGRPAVVLLIAAALFGLTQLHPLPTFVPWIRFAVGIAAFCIIIAPALWFVGLIPELRQEIGQAIFKISRKALSKFRTA
jgi:O-antigen/teichoic acid export membrane protein